MQFADKEFQIIYNFLVKNAQENYLKSFFSRMPERIIKILADPDSYKYECSFKFNQYHEYSVAISSSELNIGYESGAFTSESVTLYRNQGNENEKILAEYTYADDSCFSSSKYVLSDSNPVSSNMQRLKIYTNNPEKPEIIEVPSIKLTNVSSIKEKE